MSGAKSLSDGLGLISEDLELPHSSRPSRPWPNPVMGNLALQIHPSATYAIHRADWSKIDDLEMLREIVHATQRPGTVPQCVYAHGWAEGDAVLFHNRGVLHSVVGAFAEHERLLRQCNVAASEGVVGADEKIY